MIKYEVRNIYTNEIECIEWVENGQWWYRRTGEDTKYQGILMGCYNRELLTK